MIKRYLEDLVCHHINANKVILLFGARQVGKTTLLENLECLPKKETMFLNGDESDIRELFASPNSTRLKYIFAGYKFVVIDEAQGIPGIGLILKIIVDKIKGIQVIATGSSAFELMNNTSEPLTGRKFEFRLFPFSFSEMVKDHGFLEEMRMLEFRLVYGYYPEVAINSGQEQKFLKLIAGSYLYKDLLRLENIRRSELLDKILKALALQVGSEVSYNELSKLCGTDPKTVEKYINILEKTFIIFKLPALSRNVRNELKKGKKIYFWDNGIRNAIINNFTETISLRNDLGAMWENFIISERMKLHNYHQTNINCYFWRTSQQQEIDFIEEHRSGFKAFEFKWSKSAKTVFSKTFLFNYNVIETKVITKNNLESFLLEPSF